MQIKQILLFPAPDCSLSLQLYTFFVEKEIYEGGKKRSHPQIKRRRQLRKNIKECKISQKI